ncbi:MAG: hypothetical protein H0X31_18075, partial [Nostocaceae cyanobacterium]|nr:hypothetical protein [Nostocaceae cyanobacterium]
MSHLSRLSSLSVTLLALSIPFSAVAQTNPNPPASADPTQTTPSQTTPTQNTPAPGTA